MIAVITGDIVNSKRAKSEDWLNALKNELAKDGASPAVWEIYRGDSFQLIIDDAIEALARAIKIKATVKSLKKHIDTRMSIGIGDKSFDSEKVIESNGTAFIRSGEKFELLKKEKQNLAVKIGLKEFDKEINLYLKLSLIAMDNWTPNAAQIIKLVMENPNKSQEEIGQLIGIKQNAVSTRLKRAYYEEIMEVNEMYKAKLKILL